MESGTEFLSRDVKLNESDLVKQSKELTEIKAVECGEYTIELEKIYEEHTVEQTFENRTCDIKR